MNGLTKWRQRQQEEREAQLAFLERCRKSATTEERDGQTFQVVRLLDAYDFTSRRQRVQERWQSRPKPGR